MKRRVFLFFAALLCGIPFLVFGFFSLRSLEQPHQLDVLANVPAFQLVDNNGRSLELGQLKGYVWVADFIYTECPGPCPMMTAKLKRLQDRLAGLPQFRLVSFTVDPEHDDPATLTAFAQKQGVDLANWIFVTGSQEKLNALSVNGFRLANEGRAAHSTKVVLVDTQARIRGYYDGLDDRQMDSLGDDVRSLLRQMTTR
jgi:protein SCO1/2